MLFSVYFQDVRTSTLFYHRQFFVLILECKDTKNFETDQKNLFISDIFRIFAPPKGKKTVKQNKKSLSKCLR